MSWPTWSATTAPMPTAMTTPVQSTLLPSAINSAPAVMPPGLHYSPEQWAQAQQQNWHQWAQWQQQYQQWHQQYGAEYQKSISAMQGTLTTPVQQPPLPTVATNTGVAPPLPAENKPPLPPDDPPPLNQQATVIPSYSTMPPKPVQTAGYTTAPPPLMTQQMQPPPQVTDPYGAQRQQNWQQQTPQYNPQQQNTNKRPYTQGSEYENPKRPLLERPNQWGGQKQQTTNQWQNRPQQNVSYHTQPPPQPQAPPKQNVEELSEAEKKFDKEFAAWEAQFNKWKEQNANHPDKTQYREYEKKWQSWRNSLLERREQMRRKRLAMTNAANKPYGVAPPSVPQSMGLVQDQGQPKPDYSVTQPAPPIHQPAPPINKPMLPAVGDNFVNNPPPNLNQEALTAKSTVAYPSEEPAADTGEGFLKSSFSSDGGGIPGLDLVKEDENAPQKEDVIVLDKDEIGKEKAEEPPKPKGPDFDAISKGINTILGDQKLLSMLSIVSQNPPSAPAPNTATDSISTIAGLEHNFSAPPPPPQKYSEAPPPHGNFSAPPPSYQYNEPPPQVNIPYNDQSNHGYEERLNRGGQYQPRESVNNFDDQTRSSFTMAPSEQDVGFGGNNFSRGQGNKFGPGRFGGIASENDRMNRNTFGTGGGSLGGRIGSTTFGTPSIADKKLGPSRGEFGTGNFARDDNFKRDSFNKGSNFGRKDSFNRGNDYDDYERDFQSDDFEEGNNFSYATDNFNRQTSNFKQLDQFAGLNKFDGRRGGNFGGNSFNRAGSFNDGDKFKDNYDDYQDDDYNQDGDYDNYDYNDDYDYNEDDDYEKYHEMYNDEDGEQDFPNKQGNKPSQLPRQAQGPFGGPRQAQGPPPSVPRQTQGPPPGPRQAQGPSPGPRQAQGPPPGPRQAQGPPPSPMQVQGPPPGPPPRNMDLPPPRNMDLPPPRNMDLPPPRNMDLPPPRNMDLPPPMTPEPPPVEEEIFEPASVVDYDHKSLRPVEPEVVIEPIYMFDYRHKPVNRIPLPQRPKWLSEAVKFIREFDPLASRVSLNFERPPVDRYNPREMRREEWRSDMDEDHYGPRGRPYEERDRRHPDDFDNQRMERRPYRDEPRFDRDFKENDDRNRRNFDDNGIYGRRSNEDSRTEAPKTRNNIDFEEFSDEEMDFESDEVKKHQQSRVERSLSESPILSNPPNPASFTEITMIEDIINPPGRFNRPPRIVIILRGPPGSGKTFLAKLIKDKEVENGGSAPRILSLDDYFMVEHEKQVMEDGKMVKVKEMVYEYEAEMEESYRTSFIKSFKKTITDGYFPFIIVDNINDKVKYFGEMWSFAKQNGFQVYICQLDLDPALCTKRNIHNRSEAEIEECIAGWEPTPSHHPSIDASGLLQASTISEVEMEEVEQKPEPEATVTPATTDTKEEAKEEVPEDEVRSKWDTFDCSSNNLAKLDGTSKPLRPSRTMEDYLQLENEWEQAKPTKPGQKRVRWADLEEQREQKKMRAIGFIVGHTNWDRMMDPTDGGSALTKTKYIERDKF